MQGQPGRELQPSRSWQHHHAAWRMLARLPAILSGRPLNQRTSFTLA